MSPHTKVSNKPTGPPSYSPAMSALKEGTKSNVEKTDSVPVTSAQPPTGFRLLSWRGAGLMLGCALLGFGLAELLPRFHFHSNSPLNPENLVALPDSATPVAPGPWGNLEATPIYLEPPDDYLADESSGATDSRWYFSGMTPGQLLALFQKADLSPGQRNQLSDTSKWQQDAKGIYVSPTRELILGLSPTARKQIYWPMFTTSGSKLNLESARFVAGQFDHYFVESGLSNETIDLIRKLSFHYGKIIFFCDVGLVLDTLRTPEEKKRLLKTIYRRSTLLLRLHVTPNSNIGELEGYWGKAGWERRVNPLLEAMGRLPNGGRINIADLLPPIPSAQIYTYSLPSINPTDLQKDCRWTSLNFFRDTPDDKFIDPKVVHETLLNDYYPVLFDPRFGDIIVVSKPDGEIIHLAVYIAADIVYTKNSPNIYDPFILMRFSDMMDRFTWQIPEDQTLHFQLMRYKYY